ncbi:MAG: hypothetical protein Q9207_002198 [Kuettlingeria erythrocarpa]
MECKELAGLLPGKVFFPGDPRYIGSAGSYFAAFENELSPGCIIRPKTSAEVSAVIKHIGLDPSRAHVQLAIRGGGHTPWAGAANINKGITMDMQDLTGVQVDERTGIASIAAGERWARVYEQLATQGLAVAGGRVSKVGVAGLTTGGGLSYFSAATGFVCDNVVNYEVVLASGEIVEANAKVNQDLFRALKGGSNNFGVITRFDQPTFKQGQMWGGAIYYNSSVYPHLVQAFSDFAASSTPDEQAHVLVATSWSAGRETGVSNIYHSTPAVAPPSLKPFTDLQPQIFQSLRQDSLLGFANEQSAFSTDGARQLYFTTSFKLDVTLMLHVRELWLEALKTIDSVPGLVLSLVFQPVTEGILAKSRQLGQNSLGLSPSDGPFVITLLNSVHVEMADDDRVVSAVHDLVANIDAAAAKRAKSVRYRFTNYGYKDQQILEGYGSQSIAALRAVSRKYDPSGFFQKTVPGGFKLSKVIDTLGAEE